MQLPHTLLAIRTATVIDTPLSITDDRKLARLQEAGNWSNVTLLTRLSPALALVFRSAGFTLPEFTPARLAGVEPA